MAGTNDAPSTVWMRPSELHPLRLDSSFYEAENISNDRRITANCECQSLRGLTARIFKGAFCVLQEEYAKKGVPFLRTAEIKPGFVDLSGCVFLPAQVHQRERRTAVHPRNLVLAKTGASIGYCAVVPSYLAESNICQDLVGVLVTKEIDPYFLQAFLASQPGQKQTLRWCQGNAHPHLGLEGIREWVIPLPSAAIQKAIGNKVQKAERLRELADAEERLIYRSLQDQLGFLDDHDKSANRYWATLTDVSDLRLNPTEYHPYALRAISSILRHFKGVALGDCLTSRKDLSGGATPLGARYCDSGIGFLRVQNVKPNRLDRSDVVFIDRATDEELKRSRIRAHDIVMTITGFPGIACCVQAEELPLNTNQHSVRFQLKQEWNPFFVAAFLNSPWGKAQFTRRATGATRDAIDYPTVLSLVVPSVPRAGQDVIGTHARDYAIYLRQSERYVADAKIDVESLIDGTLDKDQLLVEAAEIETWLGKNPRPNAAARNRGGSTET
jgi:restriction endonuclease S subunit